MIIDLIGSIPDSVTDSGEAIFTDGVRDTIERFAIINPNMLHLFSEAKSFQPDKGQLIENNHIVLVTANNSVDDISCTMIPVYMKQKARKGSGSLYEATIYSPVCYILDKILYTLPDCDYTVEVVEESLSEALHNPLGSIAIVAGTPAVGDIFKVSGTLDFTGSELYLAKNNVSPEAGDYFMLTNVTVGSESLSYLKKSTVHMVTVGEVVNYESGISSILYFPSDYYRMPIYYTASVLARIKALESIINNTELSSALSALNAAARKLGNVETLISTAADTAGTHFDNISFTKFDTAIAEVEDIMKIQSPDWESFIGDEDAEMSGAILGGVQARINEAQSQLTAIGKNIETASGYNLITQGYAQEANAIFQEVQSFMYNVQASLSRVKAEAESSIAQANNLSEMYERMFIPYQQKEAK